MRMERPTFQDILKAKNLIKNYLPRTPLYSYPQLNQLLDAKVYVKHENFLPTCAFKTRGGINLIYNLDREQREKGVITASTGNHALSIAYASNLFGVPATIVMPEKSNPVKVKAIRALGANIVFFGRIFEESKDYAEKLVGERGGRFIHPANEPFLIAGVATYALEIFEDCPNLDFLIVPVGGGSGASGCCLVKEAVNPKAQVIAVQAEKAPAAYLSWKNKKIVIDKMETAAEGLATKMGYELTQEILQDFLSDFVLVSEEEMVQAILLYLELVRNLSEEAGSSPLAAALKIKDRLKGKKVVLVLTGSNISMERLAQILAGRSS
ncbi:MAG: threonine/serine dehydratase [Candidatus Aminicenantes bacterium]|nr:threonine/serine dehydratase [Candidatus Aminicenantes bacterium]MDH5467380.1 threonine/serine dehydratase [Candidatus Aminicenantes bacterium]MDH5705806.1 threonine/serine dehydratase [Candidatus Aminicenantes bacterium]